MYFSSSSCFVILAGIVALTNAHFQLQFPIPRGPFVEDDEPRFCDGFNTAVSNRTQFPLSGGFFALNSEHPRWTATALISTAQNPTSFQNFSQGLPFFQLTGEGVFCIPLNLANSNITGLTAGQNITLQIEFNGGDGSLFQCADLTLSDSVNLSDCRNGTGLTSSASSTQTSPSSSGASSAPSQAQGNGAVVMSAGSSVSMTLFMSMALFAML